MELTAPMLQRHLVKTTIVSNIVSVIAAVAATFIFVENFYHKTNTTLDSHSVQINEIGKDQKSISKDVEDIKVFKGMTDVEMVALKDRLISVEHKVDKMDDKLDKILMQTKK